MQYNQINTRCPFYRHAESLLGHREQRHVNIANRTGAGWSRWCPLRMRGWERSCRCRFCWGHPDRLWRYVLVVRNAPPGPDKTKILASCFGWTCVGRAEQLSIAGVKWIDLVGNLTLVSAKSWLARTAIGQIKTVPYCGDDTFPCTAVLLALLIEWNWPIPLQQLQSMSFSTAPGRGLNREIEQWFDDGA